MGVGGRGARAEGQNSFVHLGSEVQGGSRTICGAAGHAEGGCEPRDPFLLPPPPPTEGRGRAGQRSLSLPSLCASCSTPQPELKPRPVGAGPGSFPLVLVQAPLAAVTDRPRTIDVCLVKAHHGRGAGGVLLSSHWGTLVGGSCVIIDNGLPSCSALTGGQQEHGDHAGGSVVQAETPH